MWTTGVTLVLAGLVLASRQRSITRALTIATVAGTLIVAAAAVRVGHAGGRLVYVHNAGAAYISVVQNGSPVGNSGAGASGTARRLHENEP